MEFRKKYRILIVDDNRLFVNTLEMQLLDIMNNQIDVIDNAFNGEQAIQKVNRNYYDAIFMDVEMPIMDGINATRYINMHYSYINIIGISDSDNIVTIKDMIEAGSRTFILKNQIDEEKIRKIFNLLYNYSVL